MSDKPTLEELREDARTNYGITNAADLDEGTLKTEMQAIDKQAENAKEEEAKVQRNAAHANPNSTAAAISGASDGNAKTGNESSNEDTAKPLSKQTKPELLETAKAEGVEVDETDTVAVIREKVAAKREGSTNDDNEDDDEEETPEQLSELSREELEGRARAAGVDGYPSDAEQYPDTDSLVTAIESKRVSE